MNIVALLKALFFKPFPLFGERWSYRSIWTVALFVSCFLIVFKPFLLQPLYGWKLIISALGHGLVSGLALSLLTFLLSTLLSSIYREENWKVYHQLLYYFFAVLLVGLANWLLAGLMGLLRFNILNFLDTAMEIAFVSLIPIAFTVLSKYNLALRKNLKQAEELNQRLNHANVGENLKSFPKTMLSLIGENGKEKLILPSHQVLIIESVNNYVEVYWERNGSLTKSLLRNTLQNIEEQLIDSPAFFRCHRSYLVNMDRAQTIDGNSQGYLIIFPFLDQPIPVSRLKNKELRQHVSSR